MRFLRSSFSARPAHRKHGSPAAGGLAVATYAKRHGAQSWSIVIPLQRTVRLSWPAQVPSDRRASGVLVLPTMSIIKRDRTWRADSCPSQDDQGAISYLE